MPPPPAAATDAAGAAVREGLGARLASPVVLLNLAGVVLVGAALLPPRADPPSQVAGAVALAGWLTWTLRGPGRARDAALAVGATAAAVGAGLGAPSLLAPAIAALLVAIADVAHATRPLLGFAVVVAVALVLAAALHGTSVGDLLPLLAGLAVGALGGTTRRQRRTAELQQRELLASTLAAEREAQRAQLLEARSAAARDVHDVLAHGLGGLVLQLDAIEALLEHGRIAEAASRTAAARRLAGEGLTEARRAVAALRDPDASTAAAVADDALADLLAEHRALGGTEHAEGDPSLAGLAGPHRAALTAALREALVNVRRHGGAAPAAIRFARTERSMTIRIENAADTPPGSGGHGLVGMRERFAALGDGSAASAHRVDGRFVVEATVVLP